MTHFSPRYQKVAEMTDREMDPHTLIAFDHLRVAFSQLEWAPEVVKLYRALLSNDDVYTEGDEVQQDKRKLNIKSMEDSFKDKQNAQITHAFNKSQKEASVSLMKSLKSHDGKRRSRSRDKDN